MNNRARTHDPSEHRSNLSWIWLPVIAIWCMLLCIVPDPRPLGAPEWIVDLIKSITGSSAPISRALATVAMRAAGLALLGVFVALGMKHTSLSFASLAGLLVAPILAVGCQWINYGYFPLSFQLQIGVASAVAGVLVGLALNRSWLAASALTVLLACFYLYGTSTGISDDLYEHAKSTGEHILSQSEEIPNGDEGFAKLMELAFAYAEDNSHASNAVHPNQAAILALGVLLGEERVAKVAKRPVTIQRSEELASLRNRITLMGRNDLARHFWVSAALATLSDEHRSMTVGIGKELMDSTAGGSGFSFVDLMADRAGTLLSIAATKNESNARRLQQRIREGVVIEDFFSGIQDLPEGLTRDEFQNDFGGLGGKETQRLTVEIERRLSDCKGLQSSD
jgi:hypothetical protein